MGSDVSLHWISDADSLDVPARDKARYLVLLRQHNASIGAALAAIRRKHNWLHKARQADPEFARSEQLVIDDCEVQETIRTTSKPVITHALTLPWIVEAAQMRAIGYTYQKIGKQFGVSRQYAQQAIVDATTRQVDPTSDKARVFMAIVGGCDNFMDIKKVAGISISRIGAALTRLRACNKIQHVNGRYIPSTPRNIRR